MLHTLAVSNYRSLRQFVAPLGQLTLITGPNGSGKSNVYRALRLLAETARGGLVASLAKEGGFASTLWAGPESFSAAVKRGEQPVQGTRKVEPQALRLGFRGDDFSYAIDLGLPFPSASAFCGDPEIKTEVIWHGEHLRPASQLVERRNAVARIRRENGEWDLITSRLQPFESMMDLIADPQRAAEVVALRDQIRTWRFYDHFRTDAEAPARQLQIGTYTPVLSHDGRDLAAALQTIVEIGDAAALRTAIADAFPGARLKIEASDGRFSVSMHQHGLLRPLSAAELSDGTLRYLLWIAAMLTPRPPHLMVLNEPESSLHPDLLPALARLVGVAAKYTQIFVVSHASRLIAALKENAACLSIELDKQLSETQILGQGTLDAPSWRWLSR
ncbi:MAG TPA: AAA family ATPase [Steroidobacteraceae bacterium]|jgi:predicted ATPase